MAQTSNKKTRRVKKSQKSQKAEKKAFAEKLRNKVKSTLKRRIRSKTVKRKQSGGAVRMPMEYFGSAKTSRTSGAGLSTAGGKVDGFTWNDFSHVAPLK